MRRAAFAALVTLCLSACTHTTSHTTRFNPAWLDSPPPMEAERVDGRVLVLTSALDDIWIYSGHPSSLRGAETTLQVPIGEIAREAAVKAFGDLFRGGVDRSNFGAVGRLGGLESYRVVVAPRAVAFDYKYNELKNLGFAMTPQAGVQVHISLLDARGKPTWQRTYASGMEDGRTYWWWPLIAFDAAERVAEAAHRALLKVMRQAAADVKAVLDAPSPPAAAPPEPGSAPAADPSA
jgi:hypothetical protein